MTKDETWAHAPGLLIFYAVEYFILDTYLPDWAPWIAIASVVVLVLIYLLAKSRLTASSDAGAMLVAAYAALVLFHAVYIDLIPIKYAPWFALGMLAALGAYGVLGGAVKRWMIPFSAVIGLMVIASFLQLSVGYEITDVPAVTLLGSDVRGRPVHGATRRSPMGILSPGSGLPYCTPDTWPRC